METKEEEHLKKMHMASSTKFAAERFREVEGIPGFGHSAITSHLQITFNGMINK